MAIGNRPHLAAVHRRLRVLHGVIDRRRRLGEIDGDLRVGRLVERHLVDGRVELAHADLVCVVS